MSDNMFQQRFKDKVVLVTGGGAGIGIAIGKRFVQEGAKVWLADINEEGAKAAAVNLTNQGPGIATGIIADISNETEVSNMIDTIVQRDGSLDILVNNAARFILKSCEDATSEDWDAILRANVKGYAYT